MTIRPVDLNGMIQRTDDVGYIKHNEDLKPDVDQQNIQLQVSKKEEELTHHVTEADKGSKTTTEHDAKNEGKNTYFGDGGIGRKKKKNESTVTVTRKNEGGSFDITI